MLIVMMNAWEMFRDYLIAICLEDKKVLTLR